MTQIRRSSSEQSARTKSEHVPSSQHPVGETAYPAVDPWMRASQAAVIVLCVIASLWAAYAAQAVLIPVLVAWVIATIARPVVTFLEAYRIPRFVSAIAVASALVVLIVMLAVLLSTPLTYWLSRATELGLLIKQKLELIKQPLAFLDEIRKTLGSVAGAEPGALKVEQPTANVVTAILGVLTPALSQFILFVGALLFYLIYQDRIHSTAVLLLRDRAARLTAIRILNDINENMSTYFSTFTLVNLCLGLLTILLTWLVGLPNPLLWGVLSGVLNYVPYVGPGIVIAALAIAGIITFPTLAAASLAPLAYIAMVTVEGHFVTPAVMGRRLELNPFAVFLAIAFCTWLWGPIGAFLAVPLLMALTVAYDHVFPEEKPALPE